MKTVRRIGLLAPAKNVEIGQQAILHGADAVYIGAPRFGARSTAGNSIADLARLIDFAHRFDARVYITLNTILRDDELRDAERLIHELYKIESDALIVQDMGITRLDIPPIALHASTQADNRTPEKVKVLEQCGFSQVVLARELSLGQINEIARSVQVPLEVFVHGALCVSYSGQCYLSEAMCGRSANRGECAQYCRLPTLYPHRWERQCHRQRQASALSSGPQSKRQIGGASRCGCIVFQDRGTTQRHGIRKKLYGLLQAGTRQDFQTPSRIPYSLDRTLFDRIYTPARKKFQPRIHPLFFGRKNARTYRLARHPEIFG